MFFDDEEGEDDFGLRKKKRARRQTESEGLLGI